jgi:predicted O-methyltransferase YrrM
MGYRPGMLPLYTADYPSFGAHDAAALATLIRRAARPGCRMAEIGSWLGTGSTQVFIRELRDIPDAQLLCVDTWRGSGNVTKHREIATRYDVLGTFRRNVQPGAHLVCELQRDSVEAADEIADASLDLVFIDADHSYAGVRRDIAAWRVKLRPGGILCGHDCEIRAAKLPPIGGESIDSPDQRFRHVHPDCIRAVHDSLGDVELCSDHVVVADGVPGYATLWFQMVGSAASG